MTEFLQHMINMLILGSTYALLGIGLTLIFGIMRVVNFAHGELYAFGAYFVYFVAVLLGFNFFLSLLIAIVAGLPSRRADRSRSAAPDARSRYRHDDADHDRRDDRDAEYRAVCLGRRGQIGLYAVSGNAAGRSVRSRCPGCGCSCSLRRWR